MNRLHPALQITLFLSAFFAFWILRATWLIRFDQSIHPPETRVAFSLLMKVLLWLLPALLFGYLVRGENPVKYFGFSAFPNMKTWTVSFLAITAFCAVVLGFEFKFGHKHLTVGMLSVNGFLIQTAIFIFSPFIEEILFRGVVLKELSSLIRNSFANTLTSILFVGSHLPYWIWSGNPAQDIVGASIGILMLSLFVGWLYSFSKSIWPPVAAHIANNILSAMLNSR